MSDMSNGQQTSFSLDQDTKLLAGSLPDGAHQTENILAYVSEEAADEIPFGRMLAQGTGDRQCLLMAAQADLLIGVAVRSQSYQVDTQLGSTGLKPKVTVSVLTKGRIWVTAVDAV